MDDESHCRKLRRVHPVTVHPLLKPRQSARQAGTTSADIRSERLQRKCRDERSDLRVGCASSTKGICACAHREHMGIGASSFLPSPRFKVVAVAAGASAASAASTVSRGRPVCLCGFPSCVFACLRLRSWPCGHLRSHRSTFLHWSFQVGYSRSSERSHLS